MSEHLIRKAFSHISTKLNTLAGKTSKLFLSVTRHERWQALGIT